MNKAFCALLTVLLAGCCLFGCAEKITVGTASDEILTYKKLDPDKTTLIISKTGNINIETFSAEFESRNPDVQIVCIDITGGNKTIVPVEEWIKNGSIPDIMFWAGNFITTDFVSANFTNLSANEVTGLYQSEALNSIAIDGNIYCLPCPSEAQCIIYNKTLFDEYGWEIPRSFDEFVALCDKITADTNGEVAPWNPNAKYSNEFETVMEGFLYEQLFGGAENRLWYDMIMEGSSSDTAHLIPMYDAVQTLIDHGILKEEHFTYSATTRSKEFQNGQIAMINGKAATYDSEEYEFGLMPFPSSTGGEGYVCKSYNAVVGVPVKERDEKTKDAIERYLQFFSSEEGQQIFIGDSLQISNVKNVTPPKNSALSALQPELDGGREFTQISLIGAKGISYSLTKNAAEMIKGEKTEAECIAELSIVNTSAEQNSAQTETENVAEVKESFTILETSFYIADMYKEAAGADIGLIANNIAYRGNLMRLFEGKITAQHVNVLMPRSFENGSTLVKAKMTGKQLMDALNDPVGGDNQTGDCVYAYSGLKCEIAPWNAQGERIISVKMADGSEIDPEKTYTVAFWSGTVFDKYITDEPEIIEGGWTELMIAKMQKEGEIQPAADNRITLVWQ